MGRKSGNLSEMFDYGVGSYLRQKYIFEDNIVREICLKGYKSKVIQITVRFNSWEMTDNFKNQAGKKVFISHGDLPTDMKVQTEDLNELHIFFQELSKFAPVINQIHTDICSQLGIESFVPYLYVILNLPLDEARKRLLESQSHQLYDTIWEFCKVLYQDTLEDEPQYGYDSQQIYDLLNLVSEENPYYGQAQDLIVQLLFRVGMDSNEARDDLKLKFRHALNGTYQWLTDQLYKQLSGQEIGSEFTTNVRGDADTLIDLADRFFQMSQQLKLDSVNPQGFFANQSRNEPTNINSTNANTI